MAESDEGLDDANVDRKNDSTRIIPRQGVDAVGSGRAASSAKTDGGATDPLIGLTIADRYHIEGLLGKGGMASVYLARHIVLNKKVAIKVLHRNRTLDDETISRFQQEASGLSHLQHPNLVAISDFGLAETGHPFCVMDLVEGKSLAEMIEDGGPQQYKRLAQLFIDVCAALAYAHKKNIIHRDLKPSNIIISIEEEGKWTPKLIDFGIAKFGDSQNQVLTRTGVVFGSPYYMSPEQAEGGKLDQRSDIYSLGCTMYEAITGRPPFIGQSAMQTLAMHAADEPPAPHLVRNDVPLGMEKIVLKCLAKRPDLRYQSVVEVQRDLMRVDLRPASRRRVARWIAGSVAGALLLGLGIAAYVRFNALYSNDEMKIALIDDAGWIRERIFIEKHNPAANNHLLAMLYCRLINLDGDGGKETLKDALDAYKLLVDPVLKDASFYTWYIASSAGYARFKEHDFYQAGRNEQKALSIYEKIPPDARMLNPSLLEDVNILLEDCVTRQPVDQNEVHQQILRANKIWHQIEASADKKYLASFTSTCADIFLELAQRCQRGGDFADSITCYKQAASLFGQVHNEAKKKATEEKCSDLLRPAAVKDMNKVAGTLPMPAGFTEEGAPETEATLSTKMRAIIDAANNKVNLAANPADKARYSQDYYDLCSREIPDSAETVHAACFLAYAQKEVGNLQAASAAAGEALALQKRLRLPINEDALGAIFVCFQVCLADKDMVGAKRYESQFFEEKKKLHPNDQDSIARAQMDVGYVLSLKGMYKEALLRYLEAKKVLESNNLTSSANYNATLDMLKTINKLQGQEGENIDRSH